ncbi:MAG: hypothetical protein HYX68_07670 [Planctomycetes bacterium]|nr:hypothetical protein [Planctomycetota bacterium]
MNPENIQPDNTVSQFLFRRMAEECPTWAIFVPVLFAFIVVGLIVIFRQEKKLLSALIGGAIVTVFSLLYLVLGFVLVQHFRWMVILIPILGVALFYVGLMYIRDARSVHFLWALFLGMLRTTVYMILAVVFLMPGCQHFEKQEYESTVLILYDVSGSMGTKDDLPEEGKDPAKLPTRQDKILKFLAGNVDEQGRDKVSFIDQVLAKTHLSMYRFGPILDEGEVIQLHPKKDKTFSFASASKFLNPSKIDVKQPDVTNLKEDEAKAKMAEYARRIDMVDTLKSGTNIGLSCLQAHKLENSSYIQAIIVISDGQSNLGSDDARIDFLSRVNNSKRSIPVITIGVGQFRMPTSIRIDDIHAPEETRPDDKFVIKIPVVSTGLQGEKFLLNAWIQRKKDVTGKVVDEAPIPLGEKEGVFKGAGDFQEGKIDYIIDLEELRKVKAPQDKNAILEGEWHIWAKTPRHKNEPFAEPFHVSESVKVQVQKRALRVLLVTSGPTREYQFLRSILYRETIEKRMEMSILLQSGREDHVDQDVEPDRLLPSFPDRVGPNVGGQKFMSLSDYDVIIAFDPDWEKLTMKQRAALKEWVGTHAGGVIFVAGPVNSYKLARPGGQDYSSILSVYPVVLKDSRIHGLDLPGSGGHDSSRPYPLNFSPVASQFDFLKLDEGGKSPIAGWKGFFWNNESISEAESKLVKPRRGMFNYYPVERLKTDSNVAATFAGPVTSRIGEKSEEFKDQQPFIVSMKFGSGKTLYLGSGELWRLRAYKNGFHERIWIKMARYVASGATEQKKYGRILMARSAPVGQINFEAQIKRKGLLFLGPEESPTVQVKRIDKNRPDEDQPGKGKKAGSKQGSAISSFVLKARVGDGPWQGYFVGQHTIKEPGEYEFIVPIKDLPNESLRARLIVRKPNPELDNVRTNFGYLYQLASEASKLPPDIVKEIESSIQVPVDQPVAEGTKSSKRLFFPLSSADAVAKCIVPVPPKTDIIKGRFQDLWDAPIPREWPWEIFWTMTLIPLVLGLLVALVLVIVGQWQAGIIAFVGGLVLGLVPLLITLVAGQSVSIFWGVLITPIVVGFIGSTILLVLRQWISALAFFGVCVFMSGCVFATDLIFANLFEGLLPVNFSYLMLMIVSLLGIEWLARKLLRLA